MNKTITIKHIPAVLTANIVTGVYITAYLSRLLYMYLSYRFVYGNITRINDFPIMAIQLKVIIISTILPWVAIWISILICAYILNIFAKREILNFTINIKNTEPSSAPIPKKAQK